MYRSLDVDSRLTREHLMSSKRNLYYFPIRKYVLNINRLEQLLRLQVSWTVAFPSHFPLFDSFVIMVLVLFRKPPSQDLEHWPIFHSLHLQFTGAEIKIFKINPSLQYLNMKHLDLFIYIKFNNHPYRLLRKRNNQP